MKKQNNAIRIEEEYRNVATFLARANRPNVLDSGLGVSEYELMLRERMRLKQELWKLGNRDVVLQIDKECIEEQRRRQKTT